MAEEIINAFQQFFDSIIQRSPSIIIGTLFLIIFFFIGKFLSIIIKRRLARRIEDKLLVNFIGRMIFLFMLVIGIIIFFNQIGLGEAARGLLAGAGVSAIIIGFAFKDIGENFLAGFFLAFSRPFSIGDVIEVQDIKGTVKALNFRNTHIRSFDGKDIFIPNASLIKNPLSNYTRDGLLRYDFVVGLDYGDNIADAAQSILKILNSETRIEHDTGLKPFILLEEFGTSTVNIRIFYWINEFKFEGDIFNLRTEVMNAVLINLTKEGFSLPADIIELKIYQEGQPIPVIINPGIKTGK